MPSLEENKAWSDEIIQRIDPSFRHRWEVFAELLREHLNDQTVWVDVGCGENEMVEMYGRLAKRAVGVDPLVPRRATTAPFIQADLKSLPFDSESVDLVTLRFVVEHLARIPEDLREVERILKPGGRLLVLTTNSASPFVILPRLLPFTLKNLMIRTLLKVREEEIFPTHHRFNRLATMRRGAGRLRLVEAQLIQDANYTRRWLFRILFAVHRLTRAPALQWIRPNIVAVFEKGG